MRWPTGRSQRRVGWCSSTKGMGCARRSIRLRMRLAAAVAIQWAYFGDEVLVVRMGALAGAAESWGGDWFGAEVSRAAQVMGVADRGQTLGSGPAAGLVVSRVEGVEAERAGLGLCCIAELEEVHQVVADGLVRDFPPAASQAIDSLPPAAPAPMISVTGWCGRSRRVTGCWWSTTASTCSARLPTWWPRSWSAAWRRGWWRRAARRRHGRRPLSARRGRTQPQGQLCGSRGPGLLDLERRFLAAVEVPRAQQGTGPVGTGSLGPGVVGTAVDNTTLFLCAAPWYHRRRCSSTSQWHRARRWCGSATASTSTRRPRSPPDPVAPFGNDFEDSENLEFGWSQSAVGLWPLAHVSLTQAEEFPIYNAKAFASIKSLVQISGNDPDQLAIVLQKNQAILTFGHLQEASSNHWRNELVALASAQDYHFGFMRDQVRPWKAAIDERAVGYPTHHAPSPTPTCSAATTSPGTRRGRRPSPARPSSNEPPYTSTNRRGTRPPTTSFRGAGWSGCRCCTRVGPATPRWRSTSD